MDQQHTTEVRIVVGPLPIKSLWLNTLEHRWVHGKRGMVEPTAPRGRGKW
jgi:hypothetical protein